MLYSFGTLDEQTADLTWSARKALLCNPSPRPLMIYLLTPGFTLGYHQQVLGISGVTLDRHIKIAEAEQLADSTLTAAVNDNTSSITPEDGLAMAQRRGAAHLPYWSRLAICDFRARLGSANELAKLFRCSPATVTNVLTPGVGGFDFLSVQRRLSPQQECPAGQWRKACRY